MEILFPFFLSLTKRMFLLALICLSVPLTMLSLAYSLNDSFSTYGVLYLGSLPWLLWLQQMYYAGIGNKSQGLSRTTGTVLSALFCSLLVLLIYPFIPALQNFQLENIPSQKALSSDLIVSYSEGTLVIDPIFTIPEAETTPDIEAVWYGAETLVFTKISTNENTLKLQGKNILTVSYDKEYPSLNASILARKTVSLLMQNILQFHNSLSEIYSNYGVVYALPKNTALAKVFPQNQEPPAVKTSINIFSYPVLMLAILSIYMFASFLGALCSIRQHYAGAIALILLAACGVSGNIVAGFLKLSSIIPLPYVLEGGLLLFCFFATGLFYGFDMPKKLSLQKKGGLLG